jgi:hypothetical protein
MRERLKAKKNKSRMRFLYSENGLAYDCLPSVRIQQNDKLPLLVIESKTNNNKKRRGKFKLRLRN